MVFVSKRSRNTNLLIHIFFIAFCIMCLLPFMLVVSASISNEMDLSIHGYRLIPIKVDLSAYEYLFDNPEVIINSYIVTIVTTVLGTALSVIVMALAAYPIARSNFKLKRAVSFYIFFTMLFSGGLVPGYILITQYLKMQNTLWVLIIPGLVNAYNIIMLKAFFMKTPVSLFDSAKIDGAGEYRIFFNIVLPVSKPAIATIAFFGVLARWNDWYTALLYINNDKLLPLQFLLYRIMANVQFILNVLRDGGMASENLKIQDIPSENLRMAMLIVACGPILAVFPLFQKYFVQGLTIGAVKG